MIDQIIKWIGEQRASNAEDMRVRSPSIKAHAEGFDAALDRLEGWLRDHVLRAPAGAPGFRCRCDGSPATVTRSKPAGGVILVATACRCGRPIRVDIELGDPRFEAIEQAAKAAAEKQR